MPLPTTTAFLFSFFASCFAVAGAICTPFKVHLHAQLPGPPHISVPKILPDNWEKTARDKIGRVKTQNDFPRIYESWLKSHPRDLTETERYLWLNCLLHYVTIDTNDNGVPDWSAIIDHQPAKILFPEDPDQDGDGILNVLDSKPLTAAKNKITSYPNGIPAHLIIDSRKRPEASLLQEKLFKKFRILAIDYTDEHSPMVLRELLFLLQKGFTKKLISELKINYIYAFAGHDPTRTIASYHSQARALSVGGMSSYRNDDIRLQVKIDLLSALSHEIGHAVLFEKISAYDLADISTKFSGWKEIKNSELSDLFFSPAFFETFTFKQGRNIVSQYAMKNRHEWFAESLAASVLNDLGKSGALDENWRNALIKDTSGSSEYWVNYTNISDDFRGWFKVLMKK